MRIISRAAWIVALSLSWGLSWGQDQTLHVSFGCGVDSTYEIWLYNDTTPPKEWSDAQAFAASRKLRGEWGHLVSFGSMVEETCVLEQADNLGLGIDQQLWIGLVQAAGEGDWGWVTGDEGATSSNGWEPGDPVDSIDDYTNWASGEPNNSGGSENYGTIERYGYDITNGWNDEDPTRGTLYGFVVEYDVAALGTVPLMCSGPDCIIEIPSANPAANFIKVPSGAVGPNGEADVGVFLIEEDCSALDLLPIYGSREVSFGLLDEKIPVANYLCADRWILISSELNDDVFIDSGVVEAEFEAEDFGLVPKYCAGSVSNPSPLADPLSTDLVTYLPGSEQWGVDGPAYRSDNYMQDLTYDCGSSRARMDGNRYFGIGLSFYFMGGTFAGDPDGIKTQLILLTRQKLVRMLEWAADARMRNVLKQGDFRKMEEKIEGAIENIDAFEFLQARMRVEDLFTKFLDASNFKVANADGHNFEGEGIARSSNVLHMLDEYILPYFSQ